MLPRHGPRGTYNSGALKTADPLAADAVEVLKFENDVNVYGLIRIAQAFAPVLAANGGGAFVQLNSVALPGK